MTSKSSIYFEGCLYTALWNAACYERRRFCHVSLNFIIIIRWETFVSGPFKLEKIVRTSLALWVSYRIDCHSRCWQTVNASEADRQPHSEYQPWHVHCEASETMTRRVPVSITPSQLSRLSVYSHHNRLHWMQSRELRIVFFAFESNLESNRPSDSISNRIFESNRPYIPRKP